MPPTLAAMNDEHPVISGTDAHNIITLLEPGKARVELLPASVGQQQHPVDALLEQVLKMDVDALIDVGMTQYLCFPITVASDEVHRTHVHTLFYKSALSFWSPALCLSSAGALLAGLDLRNVAQRIAAAIATAAEHGEHAHWAHFEGVLYYGKVGWCVLTQDDHQEPFKTSPLKAHQLFVIFDEAHCWCAWAAVVGSVQGLTLRGRYENCLFYAWCATAGRSA